MTQFIGLVLLLASSVQAAPKVILVTVDGVRFQEIFGKGRSKGVELLPWFKGEVHKGNAYLYDHVKVSNHAGISLPGYRAITSGVFEKKCRNNGCENIPQQTIFDSMIERGYLRRDVAVFASWNEIALATESNKGRITQNIQFDDYIDGALNPAELAFVRDINQKQKTDKPSWIGSRFDKYTFDLGWMFYKKYHPRLIYLQFIESDEYAHLDQFSNYQNSIRALDTRLQQMVADRDDETSIVVTTDHGRGRWFLWKNHSKEFFSAMRVWAMVIPSKKLIAAGKVSKRTKGKLKQIDVRPTVEQLMGEVITPTLKGKSLVNLQN